METTLKSPKQAFLDILQPWKVNKSDAQDLRVRFLKFTSVVMCFGALVWGVLSLSLGFKQASIVPFGYIAITIVNSIFCRNENHFGIGCYFQIFLGLALPFLFQAMLGGVYASGFVMLWSVMALMASMTHQQKKELYVWLAVFVSGCILSITFEDFFSHLAPPIAHNSSLLLLGLNIVIVTSMMFALALFFITSQKKLRHKLKIKSAEIIAASNILNEKNTNINESLQYAQGLQKSTMASMDTLRKSFDDCFLFYAPKDVVSGDFYWYNEKHGKAVLAVGDCTGHGVPGAIMSMMSFNLLNEIVLGNEILEPSKILEMLATRINQGLRQNETGNRDGLDISVLVWDKATKSATFAGAKSFMYMTSASEDRAIQGSNRMIGGGIDPSVKYAPFIDHHFKVIEDTRLYFTSDGFFDQFGGPKGKKYSKKRFVAFLNSLKTEPMALLKHAVNHEFSTWKREEEQTDDVIVMGIELKP